jgi:hypothetical protein
MANDEHVALLKQGVEAWNAWRKANPHIRPDLIDAMLFGANLSTALTALIPDSPGPRKRILAALKAPGRTEGVRKLAVRFGVGASIVQRVANPFDGTGVAA